MLGERDAHQLPVHIVLGEVVRGQLGLAPIGHLHQGILLLIEQNLHLLHINMHTEKTKQVLGCNCHGVEAADQQDRICSPCQAWDGDRLLSPVGWPEGPGPLAHWEQRGEQLEEWQRWEGNSSQLLHRERLTLHQVHGRRRPWSGPARTGCHRRADVACSCPCCT